MGEIKNGRMDTGGCLVGNYTPSGKKKIPSLK